MPQFFVDKKIKVGDSVELSGKNAKHISQVLRLKPEDWLMVSDGEGRTFRSEITSSTRTTVQLKIIVEIERSKGVPTPVVAISIIRPERFEWAIQKCVEIGISKIIPLHTERTSSFRKDVTDVKISRWQKIAAESAKQSGLPFLPEIAEAVAFNDIFNSAKDYDVIAMPYEGEDSLDVKTFWQNRKISKKSKRDLILIGPEGGFTSNEVNLARSNDVATLSFGKQILRTETAAVVACTLWQYELGNMRI